MGENEAVKADARADSTARPIERVVAWFSHGACSTVACKIALQEYGPDVQIVSINPGREHPDNERFRGEVQEWLDHPIITLRSEKFSDHFDVARRTRYINGPGGARCTGELKKAVRFAYQRPTDLNVWGYATDERDAKRARRFAEQNPGVESWFPLIERDLSKSACLALVERAGIRLPAMYELGYANNNCIGCWKGGKGYWNKVRDDFPTEFALAAATEREVGHSAINGTFLDELIPGTGRYKPEEVECDLACTIVEAEWSPVEIRGVA